jgi:endonuclease YncB( thermonuclease family)
MFLHRPLRIALAITAALLLGGQSRAAEMLPGPYVGAVERVVDGDTLAVRVTVWLGQELRVLVRVRGVDAPEVRGQCEAEKARAQAATKALGQLVSGGAVVLRSIEGDKYYGRVLADVVTPEGEDVAMTLIAGGLARPYEGGARGGWCDIGSIDSPATEAVAQFGGE